MKKRPINAYTLLEDVVNKMNNEEQTQTVGEIKHGRWLVDGHHIRCNLCGTFMCITDREGDAIPQNFCPNCGAKMEVKYE